MRSPLLVLSVGSVAPVHLAYDTFLRQQGCELATVADYRDLDGIPQKASYQVAVLHDSLSLNALRDVAHFIRGRWPRAKILVMRQGAWRTDDTLYDMCLVTGTNPDLLFAAIDRLSCRKIA